MATVYLATDLRLERQVAVKVLLPNLARDASLAERFDREARILASVAHPNVAEVFDVERGDPDAGREPFYVMELCDGGSLASRIEAGGPLEPGALAPIILSVAAALGELHRRGLIHRDVKPANILFTGGRPKLADFGLAKSGAGLGLDTLTAPGTAIGTPAYMAPELVLGGAATAASDVYALAATTFHGLTGRAPRQADSLTTLATATAAAVPSVSELSPRLGGAFDDVVAGGLADEPAARPSLNAFTSGLVAALQAPSEAQVAATAATAPDVAVPTAAGALPAEAAFDETTRINVPNPTMVRPPATPRRGAASVRRSPRRSQLPFGTAVLALAFVVIAVLALSGLSSLFQAAGEAASSQPSPTRRVPATTPSPSPAVSPSPIPSPSPTRDPAAPALAALNRVLVAIDQARGGKDGLKGGEANDLVDMAEEIGRRLRAGDFDGARERANALEERIRKLHLDKKTAQALTAAVDDLLAAIPG
jgi:serine/threonine-protein kinase